MSPWHQMKHFPFPRQFWFQPMCKGSVSLCRENLWFPSSTSSQKVMGYLWRVCFWRNNFWFGGLFWCWHVHKSAYISENDSQKNALYPRRLLAKMCLLGQIALKKLCTKILTDGCDFKKNENMKTDVEMWWTELKIRKKWGMEKKQSRPIYSFLDGYCHKLV